MVCKLCYKQTCFRRLNEFADKKKNQKRRKQEDEEGGFESLKGVYLYDHAFSLVLLYLCYILHNILLHLAVLFSCAFKVFFCFVAYNVTYFIINIIS